MARQCSICIHPKRQEIEEASLKGESYRRISTDYSVSEEALRRHKNNNHIGRKIAITEYESKLEYGSSVFEQLDKINQNANTLLDRAMTEATKNPIIAIQSMREIRGQLQLLVDIRKTLYDIKNVQEFQQEVIHILGDISPKARDKLIKRLKERQGIR